MIPIAKTVIYKEKKYFRLWDSFVSNFTICESKKRKFVEKLSNLIYNKLSFDNFLELSINFHALKKKVLMQEDFENFDKFVDNNKNEILNEFERVIKINKYKNKLE